MCRHMLSDALSCPVLTAAASNLSQTWGINRARTTLGRLGERKRDVLWSTLVGKAPEQARWLYEQQHSHKHTYKHTHLHTHTQSCTGRVGSAMETLSHEHSFAILNLNHCGVESLQGFLCVHLRVCMCERGWARSMAVYLKTCTVSLYMHVESHLICGVSLHMQSVLGDSIATYNIDDRYVYVFPCACTLTLRSAARANPFYEISVKLCILGPVLLRYLCCNDYVKRSEAKLLFSIGFSPNTCLVGSFSYRARV